MQFRDNMDRPTKIKTKNTFPVYFTYKDVTKYPTTAPKATPNYMKVNPKVL